MKTLGYIPLFFFAPRSVQGAKVVTIISVALSAGIWESWQLWILNLWSDHVLDKHIIMITDASAADVLTDKGQNLLFEYLSKEMIMCTITIIVIIRKAKPL